VNGGKKSALVSPWVVGTLGTVSAFISVHAKWVDKSPLGDLQRCQVKFWCQKENPTCSTYGC
jgi:hypothetical protein